MSSDSTRVQIGDSVIYQNLKDEIVILNMTSQIYYGLDDVGATMWRVLLEHGSTGAAFEKLKSIYAVDEATLRRDLEGLIQNLAAAKLLTISLREQ